MLRTRWLVLVTLAAVVFTVWTVNAPQGGTRSDAPAAGGTDAPAGAGPASSGGDGSGAEDGAREGDGGGTFVGDGGGGSSGGEGNGTGGGNGTTSVWTGEVVLGEAVHVGPRERLQVGPGAWVRTASPEARLAVQGTLRVVGTLARPTIVEAPIVLAGEDARAEVRFALLGPSEGAVLLVGPRASLDLHDSRVRAAPGADGVVVRAHPAVETPHRDVNVKRSLITGAGTAGVPDASEGQGAGEGDGSAAGGNDTAAQAGLRLEMVGDGTGERGVSHGHVWVEGNRFVGNDVGVAVEGWGVHGLRFEGNRFEGNRRGATVEEGDLVLRGSTFRGNGLAGEAYGSNATLHLRGADVGLDDVRIGSGSSAEVGGEVVRAHSLGLWTRLSPVVVGVLFAFVNVGKWLAPRAFFAWLPQRRDDEDPLDHEVRRAIVERVEEDPGVHLRELGREVDEYHKAVYHVRVLVDAGLLRSLRDGKYRRFYLAKHGEPQEPRHPIPGLDLGPGGRPARGEVEARSTRAKLLELVRDEPGIEQIQAARELGCSQQLASYHARRLEGDGVIEREDHLGQKRLYPDGT